MNLRSGWGVVIRSSPISAAFDYLSKRINLVFNKEHTPDGGHLFQPITPLFDATHYTGNGAMAVIVTQPNVITFRCARVGKLAVVQLLILATVGGAPNTLINIQLPEAFRSAVTLSDACWVFDGGAGALGLWSVTAGSTVATIGRGDLAAFTAGVVQLRAVMFYEAAQ